MMSYLRCAIGGAMLKLTQTILYTCDARGITSGVKDMNVYGAFMNPCLPGGWRQIGTFTYCPKHDIVVTVDGDINHFCPGSDGK